MSNGLPVVSIPAKNKRSYDSRMTKFYETGNMKPMIEFLMKLAKSGRYGDIG